MTIPFSQRISGPYTATPGQTVFNYTWPVLNAADLTVVRLRNGGEAVLTLGLSYSVTGVGEHSTGGTVVLTAGALGGDQYIIYGSRREERITAFPGWKSLPPGVVDTELNEQTIRDQELRRDINTSLRRARFSGLYDAGGTRIINLSDAIEEGDAVSLRQLSLALLGLGSQPPQNRIVRVASRTSMKGLDVTVDTAAYLTETGREGFWLWDGSDLSGKITPLSVTSTSVNALPDYITKAAHNLKTGHAVFPTTSANGLTAGTVYYVIRSDVDNIKLATTFLNAKAGTAVTLTGTTNITLKRLLDPAEGLYVIPTGKAIDGSQGAYVRQHQNIFSMKWFGARGDDATDDTAGIQYTIDALPNTGAEAYASRGIYRHSHTILVGDGTTVRPSLQQAISIRGDGVTSAAPELGPFAVPSPTTFKYTGALDGTAWRVDGAIGGAKLRGFEINGNALAGRGLLVRHIFSSRVDDIIIRGWRNVGLEVDAHRKILDQPIYDGCSNNIWQNVRVYGPSITSASAALILGVAVADIGDADVNRNTFTNCLFFAPDHSGASAVLLRYCDLINFIGCLLYSPGAISAAPVRIAPPTGNLVFPSGICFYNSSTSGTIVIDPAWAPPANGQNRALHFYPFTSDSLLTEPSSSMLHAINGFDMHGAALGRYQPTTFKGGVRYRSPAVVDRDLTAATIANSTAATTLYSYTVPANMLGTDGSLELDYSGSYFNNSGGPSNFLVEVLYGSSLIFSSGNLSQAADAGARAVAGNVRLSIRDGVAAQQAARARFSIGAPTSVGNGAGDLAAQKTQVRNNLTENSANALALIIRVTHSVANANVIFKLDQAITTLS